MRLLELPLLALELLLLLPPSGLDSLVQLGLLRMRLLEQPSLAWLPLLLLPPSVLGKLLQLGQLSTQPLERPPLAKVLPPLPLLPSSLGSLLQVRHQTGELPLLPTLMRSSLGSLLQLRHHPMELPQPPPPSTPVPPPQLLPDSSLASLPGPQPQLKGPQQLPCLAQTLRALRPSALGRGVLHVGSMVHTLSRPTSVPLHLAPSLVRGSSGVLRLVPLPAQLSSLRQAAAAHSCLVSQQL